MAVAKVILNGTTLIDVTQKTVTPENMLSGITALKNDGTDISGTIQSKSSSDIIVDGALVQIPAGYYTASTSKSITAGSATTPATTITVNPSISVGNNGLVTVSVNSNQSITPTVSSGYITTGTPGTVTVSGSSNSQLSVQAAATITPTESSQVAVASGKYTTGVVTVGAVSSNYIGSNIPQKTSTDLSASGSAVIVPSGYYAATASKNISVGALMSSYDVTFAPNFSILTGGVVKVQQNVGGTKYPIKTAGYLNTSDSLYIGCSGSATYQLDTQAATTVTPTESEQTAVAAGKYTTGIVKVGAISSTYIGSGVTQNDSSDLIVSNAVVTVPSGYYAAAASTLVPDSFTISDVSNATGITAEISAGNGGGGSGLASHIIHLEFTDNTDTDIEVDYDDSLIGAMITSYTPVTYSSKTVDSAALDNVIWYQRPTETWETIYNDNISWYTDNENDYPYCWVSELSSVSIPNGSVWRVTFENVQYRCTAAIDSTSGVPMLGNPKWGKGTDDGSNVPFCFGNQGWGAWTGSLNKPNTDAGYHFKIERLVTA